VAVPATPAAALPTKRPSTASAAPRAPETAHAVVLAAALHPASIELARFIRHVYPVSAEVMLDLQKLEGLIAKRLA
jgi:hypothetical protein